MKIFRSNRFNRFIYFLWAPFYDLLVNTGLFRRARKKAHEAIDLQAGERVILVGVGTGADLLFLPPGVSALGIDLSAPMLAKARRKLPVEGSDVTFEVGDAAKLPAEDASFDVAILSLIVTVAADGAACLAEALRVLRPGGRVLVFDKFLPPGSKPGIGRRFFSLFINMTGTDINRAFEPMMEGLPCRVVSDEGVLFGNSYRAIVLAKPETGDGD